MTLGADAVAMYMYKHVCMACTHVHVHVISGQNEVNIHPVCNDCATVIESLGTKRKRDGRREHN